MCLWLWLRLTHNEHTLGARPYMHLFNFVCSSRNRHQPLPTAFIVCILSEYLSRAPQMTCERKNKISWPQINNLFPQFIHLFPVAHIYSQESRKSKPVCRFWPVIIENFTGNHGAYDGHRLRFLASDYEIFYVFFYMSCVGFHRCKTKTLATLK